MKVLFMRLLSVGVRTLTTAVLLALLVASLTPTTAFASSPTAAPLEPTEHPITLAYARAFVLRTTGRADVVAAMIHQVPTPLVKGTGPHFRTIYSSPPIWAGYIASQQGAFLHRVYGAFSDFYAQPSGCSSNCPTIGSWVGVGGFGNCGLSQAGVNSVSMFAFYEMLSSPGCNQGSTPLFPVNAGDHMFVYTTLDSGNGLWYFQVQDLTTPQTWSSEFSFQPDLTTAEWITEVSGNSAVPTGLPSVHFFGARWIDETFNSHSIVDGANEVLQVLLSDPNGGCVVPSAIYGVNDTFDNTQQATC
jgi:hypothetical protein